MTRPITPRSVLVRGGAIGAVVLAVLLAISATLLAFEWPFTSQRVTRSWEQILRSKVQTGHFQKIFFPHPGYIAEEVVITRNSPPGTPPLASVHKVICDASWSAILSFTHRISQLRLEGVQISVPPHLPPPVRRGANEAIKTTVTELVADGAVLQLLPRHPGGTPLRFDFSQLTIYELGRNKPIRFRTIMHTPEPPGKITASGSFGPFANRVGQHPASGTFHFTGADLSCFHAIAGTLSSIGSFTGTLARLQVRGRTEIPNFEVTRSHHSVGLTAEYAAIVNGTTGDVDLNSARAHLLDSTITAHGAISGEHGKTISLDLAAQDARVEDLLRLFVTADQPPLAGPIVLRAHAVVPPEHRPFLERLRLTGEFNISDAEFSHPHTRSKVDVLSAKARGQKHDVEVAPSDLKADVTLHDAVATLSQASFRVPGAIAEGGGTYNVETEAIDLRGKLAMRATLSKAAGGIKSVFLLPLDPFFKKESSGAVLPVRMTGTYSHPVFKVSLRSQK
jgi:AsmA-like C-terminal region